MPSRIAGVSDRVLKAARDEFIRVGYKDASIRKIARDADTSPRAIYTRFENKEALFAAIVDPVYTEFMTLYKKEREEYWYKDHDADTERKPENTYIKYLEFAYEHKDEFMLLLTGAKGTAYGSFTDELAECDIETVKKNVVGKIKNIYAYVYDEAAELFLERITYDFYRDVFEPFIRGLDIETAREYVTKLTRFYDTGILSGFDIDMFDKDT
ncbi:MAG: TetR/AcrR family transcriptional regulator [Lachnospiraceae bacterium]|nr:TetR/AcrR family transcriptional regulator [Lachnospiraceae bacterium]